MSILVGKWPHPWLKLSGVSRVYTGVQDGNWAQKLEETHAETRGQAYVVAPPPFSAESGHKKTEISRIHW